jgi:plasmid stabilization system protein ParE
MKVEYTKRATDDLRKVSADSRRAFGERVAALVEQRIREVIAHIAEHPEAAAPIMDRPGMRVIPLIVSSTIE